MITCQHARHLFDSYLDGELSASLQTELHAHRLSCTACQNELAMLEACGDVIAMDRREPEVSGDFTSRVLLVYRAKPAVKRRRWGRVAMWVGSPLAAAASIALVMSLMLPRTHPTHVTMVGAAVVAAPQSVQKALQDPAHPRTDQAVAELNNTPQMSESSFADAVRASCEQFVTTGKDVRQGLAELAQLAGALSNTNPKLAALWEDQQKAKSPAVNSPEPARGEVDPLDPTYLIQPPAVPDAKEAPENDGPVEAV